MADFDGLGVGVCRVGNLGSCWMGLGGLGWGWGGVEAGVRGRVWEVWALI